MDFPTVLVVDFGAQYAQLIARRIREAGVYSELVGSDVPVEELLARKPAAIVLSGGPSSVYAADAPQVDATVFQAGDVEQEVLEHRLPVGGVLHLGVELHAGELAVDVLERRDR